MARTEDAAEQPVAGAPVAGPGAPAGWAGAVAGIVGAGVALVAAELPSVVTGQEPSLFTGVGGAFVDASAASLKDPAVSLFGTSDKVALLVGMVLVALGLGALVGRAAARRPWVAFAGYGAAALVALVIAADRPHEATAHLVAGAVVGTLAGAGTCLGLLRRAPRRPVAGAVASGATGVMSPAVRAGTRREFLALAGTTGVVAAGAGLLLVRARTEPGPAPVAAAGEPPLPIAQTRVGIPPEVAGAPPVPGLTPYIVPNADFYRIDTALVTPRIDRARWRLAVNGLVDRPFELGYDELVGLGVEELPVTLSCVSNDVGGRLVGNAVWLGVPLARLLDRAGVQPGAEQVIGRSVDGFTAGFPVAALDGRPALVAVGMNGEPLPAAHGYPARLVVAGLYGYVSATKWLREIHLTTWDAEEGYWVPRGWAREAPIKTQSRIDVPNGPVAPGRQAIAGVAWAPTRGIKRVEVEVDGVWRDARLLPVASNATWVQWVLDWDATPGSHLVRARATDGTGAVQTEQASAPDPDGATGWPARLVEVS